MAIRLHHLEHGQRPESLDVLTPKYLPKIPLSPFTNQPFRYTVSGNGYSLRCPGLYGEREERELNEIGIYCPDWHTAAKDPTY